ncbi:hypothetical protein GYT97_02265 [Lactobacillus mellis]|uniref:hypothetical protein n=1 Tax=Bombilactobacillus mellis TaxID=1218508 RepID=UPI001580D671|nr:hypothetical protein [Bombilactobacillus mellis]NUG38701.1 hypothetical protein [Bombilactobacillus mellis]
MSINFKEKNKNKDAKNSNISWLDKLRQSSDLRVVWNLSFISQNKKYNLNNPNVNHKKMITKLEEISKHSLVAFANLPRSSGVEFLDPNRVQGKLANMNCPPSFGKLREAAAVNKWFSIRFSDCSRIIGKRIDNTFYVFWIDPNHDLYV